MMFHITVALLTMVVDSFCYESPNTADHFQNDFMYLSRYSYKNISKEIVHHNFCSDLVSKLIRVKISEK